MASACTFGPKIDSTKARQNNGHCDIISRDFTQSLYLGQEYAISDFKKFLLFNSSGGDGDGYSDGDDAIDVKADVDGDGDGDKDDNGDSYCDCEGDGDGDVDGDEDDGHVLVTVTTINNNKFYIPLSLNSG